VLRVGKDRSQRHALCAERNLLAGVLRAQWWHFDTGQISERRKDINELDVGAGVTGVLLAGPADDEHCVHGIFEVGYLAKNPVFAKLIAMISLPFQQPAIAQANTSQYDAAAHKLYVGGW
jgi:hypothetical protein